MRKCCQLGVELRDLQEHLVPLLAGGPDLFVGDVGVEIKP